MASNTSPFLTARRALPDELKLHILVYTVQYEAQLGGNDCYSISSDSNSGCFVSFARLQQMVYSLMSVSEIKPLVIEAFYSSNIFRLVDKAYEEAHVDDDTFKMMLPPRSMRHHVRSIQILLCNPTPRALDNLAHIANETLGFDRLKNVHVEIIGGPLNVHDSKSLEVQRQELESYLATTSVIEFDTQTLMVEYGPAFYSDQVFLNSLEQSILAKFDLKRKNASESIIGTSQTYSFLHRRSIAAIYISRE